MTTQLVNMFPIVASKSEGCLTEEEFSTLFTRIHELFDECDLDMVQTTGDFHKEPAAKPLVDFILSQGIREYVFSHGILMNKFKITNMWVNRYKKTISIHNHIHSNSLISGVFYLDDHGGTIVSNPLGHISNIVMAENTMPSSGNSDQFISKSAANSMFIFPSWLYHTSIPNPSDEYRFTIAFNVVSENLGQDVRFNRLELSKE